MKAAPVLAAAAVLAAVGLAVPVTMAARTPLEPHAGHAAVMRTSATVSPAGGSPAMAGSPALAAGPANATARSAAPRPSTARTMPSTARTMPSATRTMPTATRTTPTATQATPTASAGAHAAVCSNQAGTNNGYYYQMWSAGQGSACITVGSGGNQYSTSWSGIGDFVAGVGWQPGSNQTVSFSGSMSASGGTALASLYGWSTNPLVEYYVIEDDQGGRPSLGTFMGTTTSDGATYNLYEHQQVNQPCITGNSCTFEQYLAIRQGNTTSGTITTQNIFNAWASHGMNLGSLNYQIFATEAWGGGSGNSNFTVSQLLGMPSLTGGAITPLASDQHGEGRQLGESGPVLIEFPFCLLGPLPFQGRGARPIS